MRLLILVGVLCAAIGVAGCGDDTAEAGSASTPASAAFPVTIPHAFGETTIESEPKRVVTWGWGSTDAAIALGVVPVAIPFESYGGNAQGVLPWIAEALEEKGVPTPTVLPDSEEPPYEEIAAAKPDVILAPLSGVTDKQYELLSAIAPTVAYPGEAWTTPWRENIEIVGTALGRQAQAKELLADIDAKFAAQAKAHPELDGKTVAMVWDDGDGTFYVYKKADSRVEATEALGLVTAPSVEALATGGETFYYTLSYEKLDQLTSDILVSFADTQKLSDAFMNSAHGTTMEQVRNGAVAQVVGKEFVSSVSPPTALSLTWGLDEYVGLLAAAAAKADAAK